MTSSKPGKNTRPVREREMLRTLLKVEKPFRYLPVELNTIMKTPAPAMRRVALLFPDTYEMGMSHHGLQVLYELGNRIPDIWVERAFTPWPDMAELLRSSSNPPVTIESRTPLASMDVLAFSLMSELTYTNVLFTLEIAGIPILARERNSRHPLVVAGGACTANPLPLEPSIDAFAIGDGEILWPRFLSSLTENSPSSRQDQLKRISELDGWYVPGISRTPVRRVFFKDLNLSSVPTSTLVSASSLIHDRYTVEIMRGCSRGCRYCQAGYWYRPLRERNVSAISDAIVKGVKSTGSAEVGLLSLSTTDHSKIGEITKEAMEYLQPLSIGLSIPSSRLDSLYLDLLTTLADGRRGGLTLAPEAGSERLRRVINKPFTDEQILNSLELARSRGWRRIKLYFMLGLPTETEDDIAAIGGLVRRASRLGLKEIVVHAGNFIPKPWTPFQWFPFAGESLIQQRQQILRESCRGSRIQVKTVDPRLSAVEALLARGDRSVWNQLLSAYRSGAIFDAWSDRFRGDLWSQYMDDRQKEWFEGWQIGDPLPWEEVIDPGISREFLLREARRASEAIVSDDCRFGCLGCGIPGMPEDNVLAEDTQPQPKTQTKEVSPTQSIHNHPEVFRYLLRITRRGRASLLPYRDYQNFILRLLTIAGIPLIYAGKFHPMPRVQSTMALPVGVESKDECFEIFCPEYVDEVRFESVPAVEGIEIRSITPLSPGSPPLSRRVAGYVFSLTPPHPDLVSCERYTTLHGSRRTRITFHESQPALRRFMESLPAHMVLRKVRTLLNQ